MEIDEDVLEMVRSQLDRDPPPSTTALYGRAARMNSDIYQLSLRQFHAMYPLRVKREEARQRRSGGTRTERPGSADEGTSDGDPDDVAEDAGRRHLFGDEAQTTAGGRADVSRPGDGTRERLRELFLALAREVAEAEPSELVGIVERMPERVDEVARILAAGRAGD